MAALKMGNGLEDGIGSLLGAGTDPQWGLDGVLDSA